MRSRVLALSRRQRHRGPDWSGMHQFGNHFLAHERLAIMDPASGDQPLFNEDRTIVVTVNGEIYNYVALREQILEKCPGKKFATNSDCEDDCSRFQQFPPGHYYSSKTGEFVRYYNPRHYLDFEAKPQVFPSTPYDAVVLRKAFEVSVEKRMMSDVPFGVLLSGGLDSSLVAAIASRKIKREDSVWGKLHSFCVGLPGSPDLKAGKSVAEFLGTDHHEFHFTVQEGIDAISEVIYHIETFDVTTIRASTPMFLMSRKIKALGVKMVLSGEGSDEVFGGYLYFHKAPDKEEFHSETVRKLQDLFKYDCLRANKSTMAWGVEARVPFLDRAFLDVAMAIDPAEKMIDKSKGGWIDKRAVDECKGRIEKYILRKAFDTPEDPYLPKEVLWRQKEQFSDGVGYNWIDGLKVSDEMLKSAMHRYPDNTPRTKEAYWYRTIFEGHFPQRAAMETVPGGPSVACSTATAALWDAAWAGNEDPSGRAVAGVHDSAYGEAAVANGEPAAKKIKT
ncbi:Asparagine synthetase [glutamine-hydrolyzing] [Tetrabaena socialis]|uniref:Asparagine synthetase [glutamine-hydrolyzing] n=1 Tax=Tetrabaena socialis TaxID=47790 RepID=A0A2J8AHZ9_9CHLO|nr:Asparagine synthetase [glutamine-hydrolyzing] [Tetrabaena socialis]|eukprot:PNH12145.1 Asparagine synthetase [glutamine-hydrolyzing] [Tetrabaena socialis]